MSEARTVLIDPLVDLCTRHTLNTPQREILNRKGRRHRPADHRPA